jgi:iron-sulfur cluster assembly protein
MAISITDKAAVKVQDYLKQVNDQSMSLRVFVKAGGCAGYQFGLKLDKSAETDIVEHKNGITIVADAKSADLLGDAEIDYVETEMGGGFKFNFPGDYLTCGCGHSFIPKGKEQATGARSPEEHHGHGHI